MAGAIDVSSEPGRGATFRVTLPAVRMDMPAAVADAPLAEAPAHGGRLLIIDDEPMIVSALRRALGAIVLRAAASTDGRRDQVIDLEPGEWQRQETGVRHQVSDVRPRGSARKPDAS